MLRHVLFYTFGLKKDWIEWYLSDYENIFNKGLGPKQYKALINYLVKMELVKKGQVTDLFMKVRKIYEKKKSYWEFLWINLYFNTELFSFWGYTEKGQYTRKDVLERLINFASVYNKSVESGLNSLISTFEYTPIGNDLKIGIVWREKNKRFVKKEGGYPFDPYVVLYALYKYAQKNQIYEIDIDNIENEIFSPQKVLVINTIYVKNALLELKEPEIIKTDVNEKNHLIATLNKDFHPYDVVNKYIEKERL